MFENKNRTHLRLLTIDNCYFLLLFLDGSKQHNVYAT